MKKRPQFNIIIGAVLDRDDFDRKDKDDRVKPHGVECDTSTMSDKEFADVV
jgi:hypothetical protein